MFDGLLAGKNKTVVWDVIPYSDGSKMRLQFSNIYGKTPYQINGLTVLTKDKICTVTLGGEKSFCIPVGQKIYSDEILLTVKALEKIQVRIYTGNCIVDGNMTEEYANIFKGNHLYNKGQMTLVQTKLSEKGTYTSIPVVTSIEVLSKKESKAIVIFGDSITSMNRWVKPLQERLYQAYQDEYCILNCGIAGNSMTYLRNGFLWKMEGEKGVDRFDRDVLSINHLYGVMFAIGTNDFGSALNKKLQSELIADHVIEEEIKLIQILKKREVRIMAQTLTPRMGSKAADNKKKYTNSMNTERNKFNAWLKNCGLFDYVFDVVPIVQAQYDSQRMDEHFHQGDFLHPNEEGGKRIADACDLQKLTGNL